MTQVDAAGWPNHRERQVSLEQVGVCRSDHPADGEDAAPVVGRNGNPHAAGVRAATMEGAAQDDGCARDRALG